MSRINKVQEIISESLAFVKKFTPVDGITFLDTDFGFDYEELDTLPTATVVSKHGFYEEFAVVKLKRNPKHKEIIIAVLYGKSENAGEIKEKDVDELFHTEICEVADMLEEKVVVDED